MYKSTLISRSPLFLQLLILKPNITLKWFKDLAQTSKKVMFNKGLVRKKQCWVQPNISWDQEAPLTIVSPKCGLFLFLPVCHQIKLAGTEPMDSCVPIETSDWTTSSILGVNFLLKCGSSTSLIDSPPPWLWQCSGLPLYHWVHQNSIVFCRSFVGVFCRSLINSLLC